MFLFQRGDRDPSCDVSTARLPVGSFVNQKMPLPNTVNLCDIHRNAQVCVVIIALVVPSLVIYRRRMKKVWNKESLLRDSNDAPEDQLSPEPIKASTNRWETSGLDAGWRDVTSWNRRLY